MPQVKFDVQGARAAGYSDSDIADAIGKQAGFDVAGARTAGYHDADIIQRLTNPAGPNNDQAANAAAGQDRVANSTGLGETLLVGAGRTFDQLGKGIQQMYYGATGDQKAQDALKAENADNTAQYSHLQAARPIATAVGESLPSMVVPVGGAGGAVATGLRLAGSAAIPAALEYGTPEERAKRAALAAGGAVIGGQIIPKVAGAAASGIKSVVGPLTPGVAATLSGMAGKISPETIALAQRAKELGIPVNLAQMSDSKFMKTLQSSLEQMPFTGGAQAADAQKRAFTRAVGNTFGADVNKITPEVYNFHKQRLGDQFDQLASRNNLNVTPDLKAALGKIADQAESTGSDDTIRAVRNIMGRVTDQAESEGGHIPAQMSAIVDSAGNPITKAAASSAPVTSQIPGSAYQSIDSELSNIIKGGGEKGMYAKNMQNAIRGAMDESITPADQALWSQTRNQYKNLKAVRNIVANDSGSGNIPPSQLMNALNNTEAGKETMAMGTRGTLGELGQIGKQFVREQVPNSGTAQRAMAMGMVGGGGLAFATAPTTTAGILAGGATAGRAMNKVLNSPKVVQALSQQGISIGDLANLPPSKVVQILGGITGMSAAELMGN